MGRVKFLEELNSTLENNKPLAVIALAGRGKTQVAKEYADLYKEKYEVIWWFNSCQDLDEQYRDLSIELKKALHYWNLDEFHQKLFVETQSSTKLVNQVKDLLRTLSKNWLLIFDNVENEDKIKDYIPVRHSSHFGHVLITSKDSTGGWRYPIPLTDLTPKESVDFLCVASGNPDREGASRLAILLKCFPLALAQAAAYVNVHRSTVDFNTYYRLFNERRDDLRKREERMISSQSLSLHPYDQYLFTFFTALELSLSKISSNSWNLLKMSSFSNIDGIPFNLLRIWADQNGSDVDLDLPDFVSNLEKYSLLEPKYISKNERGVAKEYSMHEMLKLVIHDKLSLEEKKSTCMESLRAVWQYFLRKPYVSAQQIIENSSLLSNARIISENAKCIGLFISQLVELKIRILQFEISTNFNGRKAVEDFGEIDSLLKNSPIEDPLLLAMHYNSKSIVETLYKHDYVKAIEYASKAADLIRDIDQQDYLRIITNICHYHLLRGEVTCASGMLEKGRRIIVTNALGSYYLSLFSYAEGRFFLEKGEPEKAKECLDKALYYLDNIKSEETKYNTMYFLINTYKTEALCKTDKFEEGLLLSQESYRGAQAFFEKVPRDIWTILKCSSAYCFHKTSKHNDAKEEIIRAINDDLKEERIHRNRALMYRILGEIYEAEKDYEKAEEQYKIAEGIYRELLFVNESDELSELYMLLSIIHYNKGNIEESVRYMETHQNYFGDDHRRTICLRKIVVVV